MKESDPESQVFIFIIWLAEFRQNATPFLHQVFLSD